MEENAYEQKEDDRPADRGDPRKPRLTLLGERRLRARAEIRLPGMPRNFAAVPRLPQAGHRL